MADEPSPTTRPDPTWAFGAAAASLACAFVGAHLLSTGAANGTVSEVATILAAMALPGWLAVGVVLANVPANGAWPTARMRALTPNLDHPFLRKAALAASWLLLAELGLIR